MPGNPIALNPRNGSGTPAWDGWGPRFAGSAVVAVSALLQWLAWTRGRQLWALLLICVASVWALGRVFRRPPTHLPDLDAAAPVTDGFVGGIPGFAIGLFAAAAAFALALQDRLPAGLCVLVAAGMAWRPQRRGLAARPGARMTAVLWGGALLAACLFRFWRVGAVPAGLITVDEPRLWGVAGLILRGERFSFAYGPSIPTIFDGAIPFYLQALGLRLLGPDITAFRLPGAVCGVLTVLLFYGLGRELRSRTFGLLAAWVGALALWPVTFSRAEYLMSATYVPILASLYLLMAAVRRSDSLAAAAAGLALGACFNVYKAGQFVPALVVVALFLTWIASPAHRASIRAVLWPLALGLLVGLLPLLLWAAQDPGQAFQVYFSALFYQHSAGQSLMQAHSFLGKVVILAERVLPNFPKVATMFTIHGGMRPWYLLLDQPLLSRLSLGLFLFGVACLISDIRHPASGLLLLWWPLGLLPTLLANPDLNMDERRIMLSLPATVFIAASGLERLAAGLVPEGYRAAGRLQAALLALVLALLGVQTWRTYFHDVNRDRSYLEYNHANFDNMLRGIFRQDKIGPVSVLSFRKPNEDRWWGSNPENELEEHWNVLSPIPRAIASTGPDYFSGDGLFGLLRSLADPKRDPLIVLTPFHFYLEPLLKEMGGVRVADIAPVRAVDGPLRKDVGFAWDPAVATRLVRLEGFKAAALGSLESAHLFPYVVEGLQPPAGIGSREDLSKGFLLDPAEVAAIRNYDAHPGGWRVIGTPAGFRMADPWFWVTGGNFPGRIQAPLRLRARWTLRIPAAGDYAFGASASHYTRLKVDGRAVFTYLPEGREAHEAMREGWVDRPVTLEAGDHVFDIEQVALSYSGNFNHLIRLLWQAPGGAVETLPLAAIAPPSVPSEKGGHP